MRNKLTLPVFISLPFLLGCPLKQNIIEEYSAENPFGFITASDFEHDEPELEFPDVSTPEEILANTYVQNAINKYQSSGFDFNPSLETMPPLIVGTYHVTGNQIFPNHKELRDSLIRWDNQFVGGEINTDLTLLKSQLPYKSHISRLTEMIRGDGRYGNFTIYSALELTLNECQATAVVILNGVREEDNLNGNYLSTIIHTNTEDCKFTNTFGEFQMIKEYFPSGENHRQGTSMLPNAYQ
jgi:hypothetical protein